MNKVLASLFLLCCHIIVSSQMLYGFFLGPLFVAPIFIVFFFLFRNTSVFSNWNVAEGLILPLGTGVLSLGLTYAVLVLMLSNQIVFVGVLVLIALFVIGVFIADFIALLLWKKTHSQSRLGFVLLTFVGLFFFIGQKINNDPCSLTYWADRGNALIVKLYLRMGANPDAPQCDYSPIAKGANHIDVVRQLIQYKADLNRTQKWGRGALHNVGGKNQGEIARLLIKSGADVNAQDHNGMTPLIFAIRYNKSAVIDILIESGANPNLGGKTGSLPIFSAIRNHDVSLIKKLVKAGAKLNIKNHNEQSPLEYAKTKGLESVYQVLSPK